MSEICVNKISKLIDTRQLGRRENPRLSHTMRCNLSMNLNNMRGIILYFNNTWAS